MAKPIVISVVSDVGKAVGGLNQVEGKLGRVGSVAGVAGKAIGAGLLVGAAAMGKSILEAGKLDSKMREVVTLFGDTGAAAERSLGQVRTQVRSLSDQFGIAQETLTGGLYQAISAGVPKKNAFEFMQVASKAAIGGVTDVETAVDGISTTINAFGLKAGAAQKVADSMFATVKGGKTDFAQLSSSLFNVAPAAAAAGVSFKEVNAAIATLTASGTPTSVATTQIRSALDGLQKPSEALDKVFGKLGFSSAQAAIKQKGLGFALDAVKTASGGSNGKLQQLLGSTEAVAAANVIAGTGAGKFADEMKRQAESAGSAQAAFEVVNEGFARQLEIFKTRVVNIGLGVGQALLPAATAFLGFINDSVLPGVEKLGSLIGQTLGPVIDKVRAAIGGDGGGGLTGALAGLAPIVASAATLFTGRLIPAAQRVASYIAGKLGPVFRQAGRIITTQVIPIVTRLAGFLVGTLYPRILDVAEVVAGKLKPVFEAVVSTFRTSVLPTLQKLLQKFRENQPAIEAVVLKVVRFAGKAAELAATIIGTVLPPLIRFAGFLIERVAPAVVTVIGVVGRIIGKVADFGSAVIDAVGKVGRFLTGVKDKFGQALDFIRGIPGKIKAILGGLGGLLVSAGRDVIGGLISGITARAGDLIGTIKSTITDRLPGFVKSALGIASPSRVFAALGRWIPEGLRVGISGNAGRVTDAAGRLVSSIVDRTRRDRRRLEIAGRSAGDALVNGFDRNTTGLGVDVNARNARLDGAPIHGGAAAPIHITINAPVGSSSAEIGRTLTDHLDAYRRAGGRTLAVTS